MDKRLILAVAGSGKTSYVINQLTLDKRFLILTYTENNFYNIKHKILQKFGFMPENIKIFTYFSFLYSFCFKPFLQRQLQVGGITYERCLNRFATGRSRYINNGNRVYANRLVKLIDTENATELVKARIEKYFDTIIIDEIQDFAGHDFNLLPHIISSSGNVLFVGDFFQHTFDTSSDGTVNKNLHKELAAYTKRFKDMGLVVDTETLNRSYRCSPSVCDYVTQNLGIDIHSHREDKTTISFVQSPDEAADIFKNPKTVKLFYKEYQKYSCYANNWGNCKGEDHYTDVCVVLNPKTFKLVSENNTGALNEQTKNKLYVAITRTRGNLFFTEERLIKELHSPA